MSGVELSLAGALVLGAYSTAHCGVMCGGLAAAQPSRDVAAVFAGRLAGYALLGAVAGAMGGRWQLLSTEVLDLPLDWRWVAGVIMAVMAAGALWRGRRPAPSHCGVCAAQRGWRSRVRQPVLRGVLWAALPCPTLYLTAGGAMLLGGPARGAAFMVAFALATTPALLLPRWLLRKSASLGWSSELRPGVALMAGGVVLMLSAWLLPAATVADFCRRLVAG